MQRDPQQELFTALKLNIEALGYAVYDGILPPEGTPYPFVYLGNFRMSDSANKGGVFGSVYPTIHVWSNSPRNRGTVSGMLLNIKTVCRNIGHTENFNWLVTEMNQNIFPDNTTNTPLLHGVLEPGFMFS